MSLVLWHRLISALKAHQNFVILINMTNTHVYVLVYMHRTFFDGFCSQIKKNKYWLKYFTLVIVKAVICFYFIEFQIVCFISMH